jgi:hypothetical protein
MDHATLILQPTLGDVRRDQDGNYWTTFRLVGDGENTVPCSFCGRRISSGLAQALTDRRICFEHAIVLPPDTFTPAHA